VETPKSRYPEFGITDLAASKDRNRRPPSALRAWRGALRLGRLGLMNGPNETVAHIGYHMAVAG
jgi:hypothetical protein